MIKLANLLMPLLPPQLRSPSHKDIEDCSETQTGSPSRSTFWVRYGKRSLFFIWFSLLLALVIFLACWSSISSAQSSCKPDGSFSPFIDDYRWWSGRGFFQITIWVGSFTFTEAKVIDIFWDIVSAQAFSK